MLFVFLLQMSCVEKNTDTSDNSEDTSNQASHANPGHWNFRSPEACGSCHPTHYAQWKESSHAYSNQSPLFDVTVSKFFRDRGGGALTFCTGCHAPYGTIDGEAGSTLSMDRSEESIKGVTCDVCHSAIGNEIQLERMELNFRDDGIIMGTIGSDYNGYHTSEKSQFLESSEFCGGCHDSIKEYRGTVSDLNGETCQDCHMSQSQGEPSEPVIGPAAIVGDTIYPDRELHDHRFIGIDPPLVDSFPNKNDLAGNLEHREHHKEETLHLLQKSIQLSEIEVVQNGNQRLLNIGVQSLIGSHGIPALSPIYSLRQLWIDIEVYDQNNILRLRSGDLDSYGDLKDDRSLMVKQGLVSKDNLLSIFEFKNIVKTSDNPQAVKHPTVYQFDRTTETKSTIQPLENRVINYPLQFSGPITVHAKLRFRSLPPYALRVMGLEWVIDEIPNFIIDEKVMTLQ